MPAKVAMPAMPAARAIARASRPRVLETEKRQVSAAAPSIEEDLFDELQHRLLHLGDGEEEAAATRHRNPPATMTASAAARCDKRRASGRGRRHEEDDGNPCAPQPPPPWAAGAAAAVQRRQVAKRQAGVEAGGLQRRER